jgi:hypothetical protein
VEEDDTGSNVPRSATKDTDASGRGRELQGDDTPSSVDWSESLSPYRFAVRFFRGHTSIFFLTPPPYSTDAEFMEEKFEQISLVSRLGSIREEEIASKAASNRRLDPYTP